MLGRRIGEWRYSSMTLALDEGGWLVSHPDHFTPRERAPGTHSIYSILNKVI